MGGDRSPILRAEALDAVEEGALGAIDGAESEVDVVAEAGLALAGAITQGDTSVPQLMLTGLISGAVVGVAQAPVLRVSRTAAAAWVGITAGAW